MAAALQQQLPSPTQTQIMSFLNYEIQLPFKQLNKKPSMSIRQYLKEQFLCALINNKNNKVFLNHVTEDNPALREQYNKIIIFPMSLQQINSNLQSQTFYQVIGEVVRDLLLVSDNSKVFNSNNEELMQITYLYEQQLFSLLNTFIKNLENVQINQLQFNNYQELASYVLQKEFKPGKPSKIHLIQKNKKSRQQFREDCDIMIYKFNQLRDDLQLYLIGSLICELNMQNYSNTADNCFQLDLQQIPKSVFWWFYDIIAEEYVSLVGVEKECVINEKFAEVQVGESYVDINRVLK